MKRTGFETLMALEAWILLGVARAGLRFLPLSNVQGALRMVSAFFPTGTPPAGDVTPTISWAVRAAARRTPRSSCLPEALAARQLLSLHQIPAELRIGVRKPGERLAAHAWVESGGHVIVGELDDLATFQPLAARRDNGSNHLARGDVGIEMVRGRETRRVLDTLAAAGVQALLFKGTALAYTVYDTPALRVRNDTDLFIGEGDRPRAATALEGIGYVATNYCADLFNQFEMQRDDEFGINHALDIHWKLSTQAIFAGLLTLEEALAHAVPVPSLGINARAFGAVEALLVSCVHPVMHHQNEEFPPWVEDTHLLAERLSPPEWDRFAELAIRKEVAAICVEGLGRAAARFHTPVPGPVLDRLRAAAARGEPSAQYLARGRSWRDELATNLGTVGWRERVRLLREVAFPAPRYMLAAYGMSSAPLAPVLLPALYAHRGARGLWKVLTGRK